MNKIISYIAIAISVIAVAVALVGNSQPQTTTSVGSGTRFTSGLSADSTSPTAGQVRGTTLTITSSANISGATIVEGFQTGGAATVLTDANGGTYTLTEAELIASGTLEFAAGGDGQAVIALTMPATSTMTTLIPNAGDCRTWLYDASALATATTTTLTKGDGHHIIAYTANDDLIDGAEFAQVQMCRRTDTDVNTIVSELLHAD